VVPAGSAGVSPALAFGEVDGDRTLGDESPSYGTAPDKSG
jgi:hypothetical protein